MEELFILLNLDEAEIDSYIKNKLIILDYDYNFEYVSLNDDGGNIYPNWINTDTTYLPSGPRSKGFKIDFQFIKDCINEIRDKFGPIPIDKLRKNLNEDILIKWLNLYIMMYFGVGYDEIKRKKLYGYGSLNSIGKTLNISELKELDVSRCIEKSAALNEILNFLGINSSLVLSNANDEGHAYCLINMDNKYFILDPSFYGKDINGDNIPYFFEINPQDKVISFDPSVFGDEESLKINYSFPSEKISIPRR